MDYNPAIMKEEIENGNSMIAEVSLASIEDAHKIIVSVTSLWPLLSVHGSVVWFAYLLVCKNLQGKNFYFQTLPISELNVWFNVCF